jgi:LysR family transcriptional regulator, hca operon transcriptional activator
VPLSTVRFAPVIDDASGPALVVSERGGLPLLPISVEDYLPPSVVSRRLKGEQPTVDLMVGNHKANGSPILKTLLSRIDNLTTRASGKLTG